MSDGYTDLVYSIIALAIEDLRYAPPNSDDYESADMFLKSRWFKAMVEGYDGSKGEISREIREIKLERAEEWYENLMRHAREATDKRIYEISQTWDGTLEDKLIWAWQTAKHPKPKKRYQGMLE